MDNTKAPDSGNSDKLNPDSKRRYPEKPLGNPYAAYNRKANNFDVEFSRDSTETVDTLLVFAGLFSAVISALLSQTILLLQPDQAEYTNQLLITVIDSLNKNPDDIISKPLIKPVPSFSKAIAVNAALFGSLLLALLAALSAMLVKQWVRQYELGLDSSVSWQKARKRYKRFEGLRKSSLMGLVRWIPMLLHIALGFFFCGITIWLFLLHVGLGIMSTAIVGIGAILYLVVAVTPSFQTDSPFIWPLSTGIIRATYFIASLFHFGYDKKSDPTEAPSADYTLLTRYTPSARYIPPVYLLSPETLYDEKEDQFQPPAFEVYDLQLFMQLLAVTDDFKDLDATLDMIRSSQISGATNHALLLKNAPTILRHCSALATTCWKQDLYPRETRKGYWRRSRRLCRFIEWFYHQFSVEERREIGPWPDDSFARALYEDSLDIQKESPQDDDIFEDLVLSSSVIVKLHHVRLKAGESCRYCWNQLDLISRETLCEILRRHRFQIDPDQRRDEGREWDLATSLLASDFDCLVNYMNTDTEKKYIDLVQSRTTARNSLSQSLCTNPSHFHFEQLRLHLALLRGTLKGNDPRLAFFKDFDVIWERGDDSEDFLEQLRAIEEDSRRACS
ncbi:hypothetical protein FRB91_006482 [Serendipita sp. 411]|nr:hypothetical protein FRB91_006482 [Serendipita sp. 411]